jgi:hypothetical protein
VFTTGWWCNNHLEKYEFVNGKDDIPYMKWKIKNVWNHQPDNVFVNIWASISGLNWFLSPNPLIYGIYPAIWLWNLFTICGNGHPLLICSLLTPLTS